jgi:hypothetical protein
MKTNMACLRLLVVLVLLAALILPAVTVSATGDFMGVITIQNTGGNTSIVSSNISGISTAGLISSGFINAGATNMIMQNTVGANMSFMPGYGTAAWATFVPTIGANTYDSQVLYTGATPGGDIRYFPDDAGMVTNDNASLEIGGNFSIEQKGYFDTTYNINHWLTHKEGSIMIDSGVSTIGKVTASILGAFSGALTTESANTSITMNEGTNVRVGNRITFPASYIYSVAFELSSIGSPTGTATVSARRVSDDVVIGTMDTVLDVSTITGVAANYTFSGDICNPIAQEIRLTFDYAGTAIPNTIYVGTVNGGTYVGSQATRYSTLWTDQAADDVVFLANYFPIAKSVNAAVASGVHTVKTYADGTDIKIDVDGVNLGSTALVGVTAPDEALKWYSFLNGSMPFVEYQKWYVGGNYRQHIAWQYAAILTDQGRV